MDHHEPAADPPAPVATADMRAGLRAVAYAAPYAMACLMIDATGIGVVLLFAVLTGDRARLRREATVAAGTGD